MFKERIKMLRKELKLSQEEFWLEEEQGRE